MMQVCRCRTGIAIAFVLGMSVCATEGFGQGVLVSDVLQRSVAPDQAFVANVSPNRRVVVGSAVDGRVLEYLVVEGKAVAAGEELAKLREKTIRIELAGAEAELELRRAELRELEAGSRPEEIRLAEAQLDAAIAALDYARARFSRIESLYERGSGVSQDEYGEARSAALRAAAARSEAESSLELAREGPRRERIEQAAARVAVQEQTVAGLEDRLEKFTIRSPFDGFVITELTEQGAWVQQSDPVAEVVEIDPVEVEVQVPEAHVRFVRPGMPCTVRVEALGNREFPGEVAHIVPLADTRARSFPVKVRVANPAEEGQHPLMPGMLAAVRLPTGERREELMVPKDALKLGGQQPVVMKVEDGRAVAVAVATGVAQGGLIAVRPTESGALAEGDVVVIRGNEGLRPGMEVSIRGRVDAATFDEPTGD